jgi:hypothetical protein
MTVPDLGWDVSEVDDWHSTVCDPTYVTTLTPVKPLGDTGLEQASPIGDVGVLGRRFRGVFGSEVAHVIDSLASVVSASPVTSSQPVAGVPSFVSETSMLVMLTVVVFPTEEFC